MIGINNTLFTEIESSLFDYGCNIGEITNFLNQDISHQTRIKNANIAVKSII